MGKYRKHKKHKNTKIKKTKNKNSKSNILHNFVSVVTGATDGIGKAYARQVSNDDSSTGRKHGD